MQIDRTVVAVVMAGMLWTTATAARAADDPAGERARRAEEVRQTELAFAASVRDNRPDLFATFLDPDTVFVGSSGATRGAAAVVAAWAGFFAEGRPYFEWHPEIVELSGDGTLGLSRGPWVLRGKNAQGVEVERKGTFNSIWRRQADGGWKIVFDAGCDPCPKCEG